MTNDQFPRLSAPAALALSLVNWLIPGLGYILCKDRARGIALFLAINGCFLIGLSMGGYIMAPTTLSPRNQNFNIVGILTWLGQAFHGAGWILLQALEYASRENREAFFNMTRLAAKTYSDLGAFHLLVAGSLNYFASAHLYELLTGTTPSLEAPTKTQQSAAPQAPAQEGDKR